MATCDPNTTIQPCWACRSPHDLLAAMTGLLCDISTSGGGGGGSGTVTSVGMTVPAFLSVAPSTITTNGVFAITLTGALPAANAGVPSGGTQGQHLIKNSGTNYDTEWKDMAPAFTALTDGATITWTLDPELIEQTATVTLGGNRTLAFSGAVAGMRGVLKVLQDGTPPRTLTLPAGSKVIGAGAGAITLSNAANAIDILSWIYDGTNYFWNYGRNFT